MQGVFVQRQQTLDMTVQLRHVHDVDPAVTGQIAEQTKLAVHHNFVLSKVALETLV